MRPTTPRTAFQKRHPQHKTRLLAFAARGVRTLQSGFSLVEIALVLLIGGLALGAGISVLSAKFTQAKIDVTKARAESIRVALTNYVGQNYRLPCPAAPGIVKGANFYNTERRTGSAPNFVCDAANGLNATIGGTGPLAGISRGTVPCATLGIAEDACIDGYGNRFTYFVDNRAVNLTVNTVSGMLGRMTVHRITPPAGATPSVGAAPTGNQINACSSVANDNSCNSAAVSMVISHGANNGGAFAPGTATPYANTIPNISIYEIANTDNDIRFIQNEYVEKGTGSFDDVVVAMAPRDLISILNQTGIVKDPNVFMNERFELIKLAILQQSYIYANPAITPRTLQLPDPTPSIPPGSTPTYTFAAANIPLPCELPSHTPSLPPAVTSTLPLITAGNTTPALYAAGGITNDAWGRPIMYVQVAKKVNEQPPPPPPVCTVPFILVSYGPNGVRNGTPGTVDDDLIRYITKPEIDAFVQKNGGY